MSTSEKNLRLDDHWERVQKHRHV